jgi:4-amino-4-deoxy-L-arabinose transferase-like glycosyltransferase
VETTRLQRLGTGAAIAAVASFLLLRLSSFGIWDPWEVEVAEPARRLAEGQAVPAVQAGPWLVSRAFAWLGVHEWSGRLPIALCGLVMLLLTYLLVVRFADRRAAVYALLIAGTSPLFLFNARTMLGEAPSFAIQTAIALSASLAVFGDQKGTRGRIGWLMATAALALLGIAMRGALLCVLPPVAAVAIVAALDGKLLARSDDATGRLGAVLLWLATLGLMAAILRDASIDAPSYSRWLGGAPESGQPPSFDAVLERVFHAFAPWSALLPLALARLVSAPMDASGEARDERRLRLLLVVWIALGYGALTLFVSRYGHKAAVVPVAALAAAVALFLRDVERSRAGQWPAAITAALLSLLLVRDYGLYPNSPVHGMPVADFTVPEVFNPGRAWATVLGLFGALAALGLGVYRDVERPLDLAGPYRWLAGQWRRGLGEKLWLLGLAAVLLALEVFGISCFVPAVAGRLTTLAVKVAKLLMLLPPALPLSLAVCQVVLHVFGKLREQRSIPLLFAGAGVGAYAAFGFMPALSSHFSPREVYETYNQLAKAGEPLAEYKVGARAAAYYAKGAAAEVDTLARLMSQLVTDKRCWAVFPSDELPAIDRMFRARTQRHLFVADARNARAMLATNQAIPGRKDESFLSKFVKREAPKIQHPLAANFDDKVLLLGYDLKLPHEDHVGAGEHFGITWYFKAQTPPGNYRVFVHVDAEALRIHGDHDPVDGKYPVRLWEAGDVIIDEQQLEVPSSYAAGAYTIFVGFYSGETRLPVKAGQKDDANRVIAGVLRIR